MRQRKFASECPYCLVARNKSTSWSKRGYGEPGTAEKIRKEELRRKEIGKKESELTIDTANAIPFWLQQKKFFGAYRARTRLVSRFSNTAFYGRNEYDSESVVSSVG
jgi:hypothetical protein